MVDGLLIRRRYAGRAVLLRILALKMRLRVMLRLRLIAWVAFHVDDGSLAERVNQRVSVETSLALEVTRGGASDSAPRAVGGASERRRGPNGVRGVVEHSNGRVCF